MRVWYSARLERAGVCNVVYYFYVLTLRETSFRRAFWRVL
jgi:hypothetical protein